MSAPNPSLIFWQHDLRQAIANNTWTPLAWNLNRNSKPSQHAWSDYKFVPATTAIAAGSDAQALPQATINVDSTADFADSGYLVITISNIDRVVKYTGKNATQFTGCTLGAGTLATTNPVKQALVEFKSPYPAICALVAEIAWAPNITGTRGIRVTFGGGLLGGTTLVDATATGTPHIQTAEQPAFPLGNPPNTIEVFQDSGGTLNTAIQGNLDSPRLVVTTLGTYTTA